MTHEIAVIDTDTRAIVRRVPVGIYHALAERFVLLDNVQVHGDCSYRFELMAASRRVDARELHLLLGFSSVLRTSKGDFLAMPDNGFGQQTNSADYVLRVYRISPEFQTRTGGAGSITVQSYITLHDPDHRVDFPLVADSAQYPSSTIPVNPAIRAHRWLTGADFDIESMREAHDGTLWFGDEFGPFLIHTDASGRVLGAPYP